MSSQSSFKETPIGKIPKEWKVKRLEEVCIKVTDGSHWSPKKVEGSNYRIATVANLGETYIDINSCKSISKEDYNRLVKEGDVLERGDILFSKDGTVGICFAFKQDDHKIGLLSSIAIIKPNPELLFSGFGAYALKSSAVFWRIIGRRTGTALRRITLNNLKTVEIPLPPLSEQKKIAEVLSTVDEAIQLVDKAIDKTERLKRGLMQELLTKGIGHKEFKDTKIGRIPKNWEVVRLQDVAIYINGYAFSPKDWKSIGLPIIRIQNLNDPNAGFNYFDGEMEDEYIVENGDLLFSWSASLGAYIWNGEKAVLNQHIFKVIPKENVKKLFLYYVLFPAIHQLRSKVHGSTMKHFKKSELKTLIPLPPIPEQRKIAEILSTVDEKLELERQRKKKLEKIKRGLMNDLLTGKVRAKAN